MAVNVVVLVLDIEIICQVVNLYNEKLALEKSWLFNVYARCLGSRRQIHHAFRNSTSELFQLTPL